MRRFYASKEFFNGDSVKLGGDETRHLRDVLRLAAGDEVLVFDGEGKEYLCAIESLEKKKSLLKVLNEVSPSAPESKLDLTLAAAITKGEKFDLVVQKAVELGITRFVPVFAMRCDVKPGSSEKRLLRWQKIALEAAKQTGRARLMQVDAPVNFRNLVNQIGPSGSSVVLFSERDGESFEKIKKAGKIAAITGPEGGWDDSELELARKHGIQIITFGGRILRAETAAIAIAALLQHRFGDLK